jgi:FAD:protein FMN transferase
MAMTLNGIAQGYSTDRIVGLLRAAGVTNVLVSVGEIAALGTNENWQSWNVGIAEREDLPEEERVSLTDMAIATSAPYGTVLSEEDRIGHILDPRGISSFARWRRVSVIHPSAAVADGLSTAFVLLTPKQISSATSICPCKRVIAIPFKGDRLYLN